MVAQGIEGGAPVGATKTVGSYEVWRRFWYQVTRASTHVVPAPAKSVAAYQALCADMIASAGKTFTKAEAPASTFYPAWMVRGSGGVTEESVIGGHNRNWFYGKFVANAAEPVKGHLIICNHQWDPAGESELLNVDLTAAGPAELSFSLGGAWNAGILSPALSGALVVSGLWKQGASTGPLSAADVAIVATRSSIQSVQVTLPAAAPVPTAAKPVNVKLKLRYGKFYAGESNKHQMLIVYDGQAAEFTQVVSHEFGHGFGQTPTPGSQPAPLPKHPKQYTNEHGGVGSHCSTDATLVVDAEYPKKRYDGGTCVMFHQVNPTGCKQVFCGSCEPYLKLQDFASLG